LAQERSSSIGILEGMPVAMIGRIGLVGVTLLICADCGSSSAVHDLKVEPSDTVELQEGGCQDDDSYWASHGADCRRMRGLCRDPGYWGELVKAACPRTCDLCPAAASQLATVRDEQTRELTAIMDASTDDSSAVQLLDDEASVAMQGNQSILHSALNQSRQDYGTCTAVVKSSFGIDETTGLAVRNETVESLACVVPTGDLAEAQESLLGLLPTNASSFALGESLQDALLPVDPLLKLVTSTAFNSSNASMFTWDDQAPSTVRRRPSTSSRRGTLKAVFNNHTELEASKSIPANMSIPLYIVKIAEDLHSGNMKPDTNQTEAGDGEVGLSSIVDIGEDVRQCPAGYEQIVGEVNGCDQWSGSCKSSAASMEACAQRCSSTKGCGSFEFSPSSKRCFRKTQTRPTEDAARGDFIYCRRRPCPSFTTKEACLGPDVPEGFHTAEVELQPGSYCIWSAGACQAPMACSPKDCFLPDGGLPGMHLPKRHVLWAPYSVIQASILAGVNPLGASLLGTS